MLRLRKLVHDSGGRLRVAGPSDAVWGVLLTTGLDKVFAFDPDPATALAHVQIGTE
jgi:anti-anti-sigma regulatory factor